MCDYFNEKRALKISELITKLLKIKKEQGDIPVAVYSTYGEISEATDVYTEFSKTTAFAQIMSL
jgi:hypothetical protein